jgi:hypothetical protein
MDGKRQTVSMSFVRELGSTPEFPEPHHHLPDEPFAVLKADPKLKPTILIMYVQAKERCASALVKADMAHGP